MCPNKPELTKILVESGKYKLAATFNKHIEKIVLSLMGVTGGLLILLLTSMVGRIIYDVINNTPVAK